MANYIISTDGACRGNPGPGSWAFVVFDSLTDQKIGKKYGSLTETTNNAMEGLAILMALQWLTKHNNTATIYTDSNLWFKTITEWRHGWKSRGWKKADKKPPANLETVKAIDSLWDDNKFKVEWVKGHAGNKYNEAADYYCNLAFGEHL